MDKCEISSNENCTVTLTEFNTTNFMNETLDDEKFMNKTTDLAEIIAQWTQTKFRSSDGLTLTLDANLTNSNLFNASTTETSALIVSANTEINSSLSDSTTTTLQNTTQSNTSEFEAIPSAIDDLTKMKHVNPELKTNATGVNCVNYVHGASEMKSDTDEMSSRQNVIFASERSAVKSDLQKFLEIVRDGSNALLQSFRISTTNDNTTLISDNVTLIDSNTDNSSATLNNESKS